LTDTTNTSKSDTNILVPRSLFDRSNLLLNTQSSSLSTNTFNKSKQIPNNNNNNSTNNNNNAKLFPTTIPTSNTPQPNLKARQLYTTSSSATSINQIPASNQPSISTTTILPGQRPVQVLPQSNNLINEINTLQQKQVGTVQISSTDYRHVRAVSQQHQTTTANTSSASTNIQVRPPNYQRSQSQVCNSLFALNKVQILRDLTVLLTECN
ncbi:unnamed protein product, partial [Rotaria magnacalcarata]